MTQTFEVQDFALVAAPIDLVLAAMAAGDPQAGAVPGSSSAHSDTAQAGGVIARARRLFGRDPARRTGAAGGRDAGASDRKPGRRRDRGAPPATASAGPDPAARQGAAAEVVRGAAALLDGPLFGWFHADEPQTVVDAGLRRLSRVPGLPDWTLLEFTGEVSGLSVTCMTLSEALPGTDIYYFRRTGTATPQRQFDFHHYRDLDQRRRVYSHFTPGATPAQSWWEGTSDGPPGMFEASDAAALTDVETLMTRARQDGILGRMGLSWEMLFDTDAMQDAVLIRDPHALPMPARAVPRADAAGEPAPVTRAIDPGAVRAVLDLGPDGIMARGIATRDEVSAAILDILVGTGMARANAVHWLAGLARNPAPDEAMNDALERVLASGADRDAAQRAAVRLYGLLEMFLRPD